MPNIPTVKTKVMKISFWFFILIAIVLVTFSVQNSESTEISFLIWTIQISKAVLIIATFLLGLITGSLYGYFSHKPKKTKKAATPVPAEDISFDKKKEDSSKPE